MNAKRIGAWIRKERAIVCILAGAFVLRIVGIGYGLPLIVIGDETPFMLGALQMLQLHTLIPALHAGDFQTILPYPPFGSYLLLLPFAATIALKYLFFHGSFALFIATQTSDLSPFLLIARFVSVVLGTVTVYLT